MKQLVVLFLLIGSFLNGIALGNKNGFKISNVSSIPGSFQFLDRYQSLLTCLDGKNISLLALDNGSGQPIYSVRNEQEFIRAIAVSPDEQNAYVAIERLTIRKVSKLTFGVRDTAWNFEIRVACIALKHGQIIPFQNN